MDKDTPVGPRGRSSSAPPKPCVIPLRPVRRAVGARNVRGDIRTEGAKHLGKLDRIERGPLKEYIELSTELEKTLDAIISGEQNNGEPKKRAAPGPGQ